MKIEVIVEGKCSITVRTEADDYTQAEMLAAARSLARVVTKLSKDTAPKKEPFGFAAGTHADTSRCHDDVPAELPGADQDVPGYLPESQR